MKLTHLFSVSAEGGPLLFVDGLAARRWRGSEGEGADYRALCARFDVSPEAAAVAVTIGERRALAWEMSGAGTADAFRRCDGSIRIVRSWTDSGSSKEIEELAALESASRFDVGEIDVPSGLLAVLWAAEAGTSVPVAISYDVQTVRGTSIDETAFVLKVHSRSYRCQHDEVRAGTAEARRLTLVPLLDDNDG